MATKTKTVGFMVADETDTAEYEAIVEALGREDVECVIVAPDQESLDRICLAGRCPVRTGVALQTARQLAFDAVVIPAGRGVDAFLHQDKALDFLRKVDERGALIVSIGRGTLLLAAADLVDGRHLAVADELERDIEPMGGVQSLAAYLKEGTRISARGTEQLSQVAEALSCALQDARAKR